MELSDATEKIPAIPGIDPGTFRLVAQYLNHYATPGPAKMERFKFPAIVLPKRGPLKFKSPTDTRYTNVIIIRYTNVIIIPENSSLLTSRLSV
jgi:hypothetical protein